MKHQLTFCFLLCSLLAYAQPALQDTTRFLVFDPVKSFVTTGAGIRAHSLGNAFTAFSGPNTSIKTFTLPNVSSTILTDFNTVTVSQGGTGGTTFTGLLRGNGTSAFSAITSSTVGQVLRVTGADTYAFGAVDLADADAVTGVLPAANGGNETTTGRATGQTAANASVATHTVGGADESFDISVNVLLTTAGSVNFTCRVDFTDESNTARTIVLNLIEGVALVPSTNVRFDRGPVFCGLPIHIRCKASTSITIYTTGTFTGGTYNVEGRISKI